jgi:hypothetical protein
MRRLYEDDGLRRRLGAAAAATMRSKCNSRVLGEQMRELLEKGGRDARTRRAPAGPGAASARRVGADPASAAAAVADQPLPVEEPS